MVDYDSVESTEVIVLPPLPRGDFFGGEKLLYLNAYIKRVVC